jgi:hypothetical protein
MSLTQSEGDRLWARLVEASENAGDDRDAFLARLVLMLANEVGDLEQILELIEDAE